MRLRGDLASLDEKARQAIAKDGDRFKAALGHAVQRLSALPDTAWQPETLEAELRALAQSVGWAAGKVFQPIRIALTGSTVSEPVNVLLSLVGKEESLNRMRRAME